jgi:hypothetical protein
MIDILSLIPGRKKVSTAGWYSFNAVCCSHFGHKSDRRSRGGIKFDGNNWSYNCFNCNYKCSFILGKTISYKTKQLLTWLGLDEEQIQKLNLESIKQKDLIDWSKPKKVKLKVKFKEQKLPECELIDIKNPSHKIYVDYLLSRKIDITKHNFYCTPNMPGRMANRVIIPFYHNGKIVGHSSRFLDDRMPKYINEQQQGYVYGLDFQKPNWDFCIVTEGIFDACSIQGCAVLHSTINQDQILLLSSLNKRIVYVPDLDKPGLESINTMLDLGYYVSIPNWHPGVKDINEAVKRYGRLPTLMSIIQNMTNSRIKIELRRKKIANRI